MRKRFSGGRAIVSLLLVSVTVLVFFQQAKAYSALDDQGLNVGTGLLGGSSDIVALISLTGIQQFVVWQVYAGGIADASIAGGSFNYKVASSDEDACEGGAQYWFGPGVSAVAYRELFTDDTAGGAHKGGGIGVNLGGGVRRGKWGMDGYIHYFPEKHITAFQGMITYSMN